MITNKKNERGFTILEYCAGAVVVMVVLWAAFDALGGNMRTFMQGVGSWLTKKGTQISSTQ
jgi:Flp pilus assembly pilin Flp